MNGFSELPNPSTKPPEETVIYSQSKYYRVIRALRADFHGDQNICAQLLVYVCVVLASRYSIVGSLTNCTCVLL